MWTSLYWAHKQGMWDYVGALCPEISHINLQNNWCTQIYILLSDVSYYCEQQHNHIQIQNWQAMMCEGYIMSVSQGTYIYVPWWAAFHLRYQIKDMMDRLWWSAGSVGSAAAAASSDTYSWHYTLFLSSFLTFVYCNLLRRKFLIGNLREGVSSGKFQTWKSSH